MSFTRKSLFASAPTTSRGQSVQLSADAKNTTFLYCNGRTVIMRDLKNPELSQEYTEHTATATVARYSPSGFYIASGDVQGNVRIWDTVNETHILKIAARPISGRINDLAWDSESKRLIAVGDGKEKYGASFTSDTANSCGDIIGHTKVANSCSIRPNRPYRAATGGDDMIVNFYHGPPYKFQKSITDHTRFVQSVRFSPDGQFLVTVGSDAKIYLYDGATGDKITEISDGGAHTGGIFSVSWAPDSKSFLTSSADTTCKIWDVSARKCINTITFGTGIEEQQVGSLWAGDHILSLSLAGDFNYLDPRAPKKVRSVYGHQKAITAITHKPSDPTFYTGSYDGRVYSWELATGLATPVTGNGHTNQVSVLSAEKDACFSVGLDDTLRSIDMSKKQFTELAVPTESQPKALATHGDFAVVVTLKEIVVFQSAKRLSSFSIDCQATAASFSSDGTELAVGGDDHKIRLYTVSGTSFKVKNVVLSSNRGSITALSYSPNGAYLAAADTDRKVIVYDTKSHEVKFSEWVFHTARVNCLAWAPDSLHAVSGGLDRDIFVWSVQKPMKFIQIKGAHQEGVTGISFLDNDTVLSVGQDACVKVWNLKHHAV